MNWKGCSDEYTLWYLEPLVQYTNIESSSINHLANKVEKRHIVFLNGPQARKVIKSFDFSFDSKPLKNGGRCKQL
jgi:hypothetical protein